MSIGNLRSQLWQLLVVHLLASPGPSSELDSKRSDELNHISPSRSARPVQGLFLQTKGGTSSFLIEMGSEYPHFVPSNNGFVMEAQMQPLLCLIISVHFV